MPMPTAASGLIIHLHRLLFLSYLTSPFAHPCFLHILKKDRYMTKRKYHEKSKETPTRREDRGETEKETISDEI
jgi:hypothetical protein